MRCGYGLHLDDKLCERIDELRIAREVGHPRGALRLQRLRIGRQHIARGGAEVSRGSDDDGGDELGFGRETPRLFAQSSSRVLAAS